MSNSQQTELSGMKNIEQIIQQAIDDGATSLFLDNIHFTHFPDNFRVLAPQLTVLQIMQSPCEAPVGPESLAGLEYATSLEMLILQGCSEIESLDVLATLPALKELYLGHMKKICSLDAVATIPNLESMTIDAISYQVDYSPLAQCQTLRFLDFQRSVLGDLSWLRQLPDLQSLSFNLFCDVTCGYDVISELTTLRSLTVLLIKELNQHIDFSTLTQLQELDLSLNHEQFSLDFLYQMPEIERLKLKWTDRQAKDFVIDWPMIRYLATKPVPFRTLDIRDVNLQGIPPELIRYDGSFRPIRDFYHAVEQGEIQHNEIKLMILGNGRIGKTQLLRRLNGQSFDECVPSTHGIAIEQVPLQLDDKTVQLACWDFGGQDIYLGTHSLFADKRAVYCLLWHPDYEQNTVTVEDGIRIQHKPLSYWLSYIHSLAGKDANILILQSQVDSPEQRAVPPIPAAFQHNQIRTLDISAVTEDGLSMLMPALKQAVKLQLQRNGTMRFPASWQQVIDDVDAARQNGQKRLPYQEYEAICKAHQVAAPMSLLRYMANAGKVFFHGDLFKGDLVLDQSWALQAVYSLHDRQSTLKPLIDNHGKFTLSQLNAWLWQDQYNLHEQHEFMSMMRQCDICFAVNTDDDLSYFIAPDCLPDKAARTNDIAMIWRGQQPDAHVQLDYPFLHDATMRGVLATLGERLGQHAVFWRYGCASWLAESDCLIQVDCQLRATTDDEREQFGQPGIIDIKVAGSSAADIAEHLVESIKYTTMTGKKPGETWLVGEPDEWDFNLLQSSEPFEQITPSAKRTTMTKPTIYFSYAWGKEDDHHQQVCDDIYHALEQDFTLIRDRETLNTDDSIEHFQREIGAGALVIVIYSAKSLASENCMKELSYIQRTGLNIESVFRKRVIPVVLGDVNLSSALDCARYAKIWRDKADELEQLLAGTQDESAITEVRNYRQIADSLMSSLTWSRDIILDRNHEEMKADGYQILKNLIRDRVQ